MRGSMKKRNKKTAKILAAVLAAALGVCVPETTLQAAETRTSVQIQMPGFVVEQFSAPRLMNVTKNAVVRTLPDNNAARLASVTAGNTVWGWGQTNTGWYFVQVGSQIGYVCYEAAAYATQEQIAAAQAAQQAAVAQQAAPGAGERSSAGSGGPAGADRGSSCKSAGSGSRNRLHWGFPDGDAQGCGRAQLGQLRGSSRCQKRKPARMAARHWDPAGGQDHRQRQQSYHQHGRQRSFRCG